MEELLSRRSLKALSCLLCVLLLITALPALSRADDVPEAPQTTVTEPTEETEATEETKPTEETEPTEVTEPTEEPEQTEDPEPESDPKPENEPEPEEEPEPTADPKPTADPEPEEEPERVLEEAAQEIPPDAAGDAAPVYAVNIPDCIDLTDGNTFTITVQITSGAEAIAIDVTSNDWMLGGAIPYHLEGLPGTFADGAVQAVTVRLEADVSHLAGEYADMLTFTFTPCTAAE